VFQTDKQVGYWSNELTEAQTSPGPNRFVVDLFYNCFLFKSTTSGKVYNESTTNRTSEGGLSTCSQSQAT
jgi:hypothetical protein